MGMDSHTAMAQLNQSLHTTVHTVRPPPPHRQHTPPGVLVLLCDAAQAAVQHVDGGLLHALEAVGVPLECYIGGRSLSDARCLTVVACLKESSEERGFAAMLPVACSFQPSGFTPSIL